MNGDEPCKMCYTQLTLRDGCEPTGICDLCAQDRVQDLEAHLALFASTLRQILDPPPGENGFTDALARGRAVLQGYELLRSLPLDEQHDIVKAARDHDDTELTALYKERSQLFQQAGLGRLSDHGHTRLGEVMARIEELEALKYGV